MLRGVVLVVMVMAACIHQAGADDGLEHLRHTAHTYQQLKTLQVETVVARLEDDGYKQSRIDLRMALYGVRPAKLRIDTKASNNTLRATFIFSGHALTEYRAWANEYQKEDTGGVTISFSPERGAGLGEMIYDTIADGVHSASVRGRRHLSYVARAWSVLSST